ncbi:MAG: XRE family transcriptional regulator [Oscillospiraceae bacterium]|nr:XRE family transcriptional regulator [Oscillospiraceae bacterium]
MNSAQMIKIIDDLAKRGGVSRHKLLNDCGVKSYVDNLKKDKLPNIATIAKIADYLGVSIDYLAGRTDNPEINA